MSAPIMPLKNSLNITENERDRTMSKLTVENLYFKIWNKGEFNLLKDIVAESYTIFDDPGDAWEGKSLNHEEYEKRVMYTRAAFPNIQFELFELISENEFVAVRWKATGTHLGDLHGLPATGKKLSFSGQTFYKIKEGRVCGHWQMMDRLGFYQQATE